MMKYSATELEQMVKYLDYVAKLKRLRRFTHVMVEETIEVHWLTGKPKTTADLVLATADELHIVDGKWGKIPVSPVRNAQLMYYAVTWAHLAPKAKGATLHILQPPADNFESWFVDTNELAKFKDDAVAAEAAIAAGDLTFGPGDHCTFCAANPHGRGLKGRPFCPVLMQMHYPAIVNEDEILAL